MHLSVRGFIVIVSLLTSVGSTEFERDCDERLVAVDDRTDEMRFSESAALKPNDRTFYSRATGNCQGRRRQRQASHLGGSGGITYVKAILSNQNISADERLAEKLARAELESPKMQETFKKLTAIHSHRGRPLRLVAGDAISAGSPESFSVSAKVLNSEGPRGRKKTRHRSRRRNHRRTMNLNERKTVEKS